MGCCELLSEMESRQNFEMRRAPLYLLESLTWSQETLHLGSYLSLLKFREAAPPSCRAYPRTGEYAVRSWHSWRGEWFRRVLMAAYPSPPPPWSSSECGGLRRHQWGSPGRDEIQKAGEDETHLGFSGSGRLPGVCTCTWMDNIRPWSSDNKPSSFSNILTALEVGAMTHTSM